MDSARLVPLGRALADHGLSRKAWDALVEARLIDAPEQIDGGGEYGLDDRQMARFQQLMDCRRSLGGRFRVSTLAFETSS